MHTLTAECMFDGRTFRPGPWRIQIDGGKISNVLPLAPADAASRDGRTILPGLIDAHVHLTLDASMDPVGRLLESRRDERISRAEQHGRVLLAAGVTTVRDCGSPPDLVPRLQALGGQSRRGPHVLCAGMPVTTPNGHCHFFGAGTAEGREADAVDRFARDGVDFIKVMVTGGGLTPGSNPQRLQYDDAAVRRIVTAADRRTLPTVAHVHTEEGILAAVRARVRSIEHATGLRPEGIGVGPDVADALRDSGIYVTPTLSGFLRACRRGVRGVQRTINSPDPERLVDQRLDAVDALIAAGVRLVAGTDAGTRLIAFDDLGDEVRALRAAGLPTEDCLAAATSLAAACLDLPDAGWIRPSASADLITVRGNTPDAVLERLGAPDLVLIGGEEVYRA